MRASRASGDACHVHHLERFLRFCHHAHPQLRRQSRSGVLNGGAVFRYGTGGPAFGFELVEAAGLDRGDVGMGLPKSAGNACDALGTEGAARGGVRD